MPTSAFGRQQAKLTQQVPTVVCCVVYPNWMQLSPKRMMCDYTGAHVRCTLSPSILTLSPQRCDKAPTPAPPP